MNSEIQKYIWRDFSIHRIVIMPAILIAIIMLVRMPSMGDKTIVEAVIFQLYAVIVGIWGTYRAGSAISSEVAGNTWDNHRLSSTSPFSLAFGKLFGSTLYHWYGATILIFMYIGQMHGYKDNAEIMAEVALLISSGMFAHAAALFLSIVDISGKGREADVHSRAYIFLAMIAGAGFYFIGRTLFTDDPVKLSWFGIEFAWSSWVITSLALYLFWCLVGIYRMTASELQIKNTPWVWSLFLISMTLFYCGFVYIHGEVDMPIFNDDSSSQGVSFIVAILIMTFSTYVSFPFGRSDITQYRMLFDRYRKREWRRFAQSLPLWFVSLALLIAVCITFITWSIGNDKAGYTALFIVNLFLFIARDALIYHYFLFSSKSKRPLRMTLLYLGILYILLPWAVLNITLDIAVPTFFPIIEPDDYSILDIAPILLQVAVMGLLVRGRYRKLTTD